MPHTFIFNPAAANGRARRLRPRLEAIARDAGVAFEAVTTQAPGHAVELARAAAAAADVVVAIGGDGTIQEVAAGLLGTGAALGVIPVGTGNDFARSLGLPTKPVEAARLLPFLKPQRTDLGRARWRDADGAEHGRHFVNALGTGFDAYTALLAERYKSLPGQAAYLAGVLQGLRTWTNPTVRIHVTAQPETTEPVLAGALLAETASPESSPPAPDAPAWYEGPFFLLALGNGNSVGGGFRLTPDAYPDDARLDACLLRGVSALRALQLLPRAMRGAHADAPEVTLDRVASATLDTETPLPVHADGEILTTSATWLHATIEPGVLPVLRP